MNTLQQGDTSSATEQSLLAKALRDPIYGSAYKQLGSLDSLIAAGFFDDGAAEDASDLKCAGEEWLITPTFKIVERLRSLDPATSGSPLLVLLSTGALCPIHQGHVDMMEIAKEELEGQGAVVLGGYLAPDHDQYVSAKNSSQSIDAVHRLRLCEEALKDHTWLMADGWASLGVDRALNFTDILLRLERYLARHLKSDPPVEVVYVFGSDNAGFTRAFLGRGRCVCILRPGSETRFHQFANDPLIAGNSRIVFAKGQGRELSSRAVRSGEDSMLNGGANRLLKQWKDGASKTEPEAISRRYCLRNEGRWVLEPWLGNRDAHTVIHAWNTLVSALTTLLERAYREADWPDRKTDVSFQLLELERQQQLYPLLTSGGPVISLDPCIPGDFNLSVSRCFQLSCGRSNPVMIARPGHESLQEQMRLIPEGSYTLFDDDIASGTTMRLVQEMLPTTVNICRVSALTQCDEVDASRPIDICDCRDFLAGSREGGLVLRLSNGSIARAPYTFPYVSLWDRASIPPSKELSLSYEIWALNRQFFASIDPPIALSETSYPFQNLMQYLGFTPDTPMTAVCQWHLDRLPLTVTSDPQK